MRIARIIEYFPPHVGGMERHGLILSQEQVKLGHKVDVFIGFGDSKRGTTQIEADKRGNYLRESVSNLRESAFVVYKAPLQFLPMYSKIRRFWFNFWAYSKVKKIHKKNPYDIIHLHGDFIEAYFGGKLSKKLNIPSALTIHAGLNKRFLEPKNAKYFENINKIICVSQEIANDLKSIGVSENKLAIISSGIYLDEFKNTDEDKSIDLRNRYFTDEDKSIDLRNRYFKPIIISVGVLRQAKGFEYLIEAFEIIKEKFGEATLLLIGDGLDKNKLEARAKNIGSIYFLGRQNHGKIVEYLKAADIFVLASISTLGDREGTPTSIMEAMAAGLPVVATKVGGNPYLINEGENGLLVEEKNPEALAEAMLRLMNDENLRRKMREENLKDIQQKNWPDIAKRISDVYYEN